MTEQRRADEDAWVVPDSWWAEVDRFRGKGPARPVRLDAEAEARWSAVLGDDRVRPMVELTAAEGFTELGAAGAALLDGTGESPLGAAVVGLIGHRATRRDRQALSLVMMADAWVGRYGAGFAAEAAVRMAGLTIPSQEAFVRPLHPAAQYNSQIIETLRRLRGLLAELPEAEYRAVVDRIGVLRTDPGTVAARVATVYLFPTEQEWLDADLHIAVQNRPSYRDSSWTGAVSSATTLDQLTALSLPDGGLFAWDFLRFAVAVHIGPQVAPLMAEALDNTGLRPEIHRAVAEMLTHFPTDEAFTVLLERIDRTTVRAALYEAIGRFPRRALRLLAAVPAPSAIISGLLRAQAHMYPELAAQLGIAARLAPSAVTYDGTATPDELPDFLRIPPWDRPQPSADSIVIPGLGTPRPVGLDWQDGERERWATARYPYQDPNETEPAERDWQADIDAALANQRSDRRYKLIRVFCSAPVELLTPHLDVLRPDHFWSSFSGMDRILARFGEPVVPLIFAAAQLDPADRAEALTPLSGTEVTRLMARLLGARKSAKTATAWFERHIATAAPDLLAAALDKPARPRKQAWAAIHLLSRRGHRDLLLAAAADFGPEAVAALEAELITDPLLLLPAKLPTLPSWLIPATLPPIVLHDGRRALPPESVQVVCTMLAISEAEDRYAGVDRMARIADPVSLAEFAWALFDTWRAVNYPAADGWVLRALGWFGNDETARRLTPLIRAWPGESAHQRAVNGMAALAAIGTDIALMQLNGIAEKVKFKGIKAEAQRMIERIARQRGLTAEQLADRLAPDLGLSAAGVLHLDFGPRQFRIGLDEQLRPTIGDADGAPRKSLPKPGGTDDPELAAAAVKQFSAFKKDVKTIASGQIRRLEHAMVAGRRWSPGEYRQLFVDHPLVRQSARRLVWAIFDAEGAVIGSARIAEDGSLADAHDASVTLPDDARLGIAHPLHLPGMLPAWGEVFADYEILQPFPQLARETYRLTEEESGAVRLARFMGIKVPVGNAMGLMSRGWEREAPGDNGDSRCVFRALGGDVSIVVDVDPGFSAGMPPDERGDHQELDRVWLKGGGPDQHWWPGAQSAPFGVLDPVTASEVLRDLEYLTAVPDGGR
ncbi:DUF4132 domain-containing protein [Nocardia crassostreae]|uniref:DUF4132 domain-containing protein n=1 Tax=Nocardia crassostreae TaxID=53428 RepID=UPI000833D14D|nr:DUF4132 domain-containing protein [Nocardia crassostreae]